MIEHDNNSIPQQHRARYSQNFIRLMIKRRRQLREHEAIMRNIANGKILRKEPTERESR